MTNKVSLKDEFRSKEDFSEFEIFDGEEFIRFNIIEINEERNEVTIAVTDRGHISVLTFDLYKNKSCTYIEYGPGNTQITIDEMED